MSPVRTLKLPTARPIICLDENVAQIMVMKVLSSF